MGEKTNILNKWFGYSRARIIRTIIFGLLCFFVIFAEPYSAFFGKFLLIKWAGLRIFAFLLGVIMFINAWDAWNT